MSQRAVPPARTHPILPASAWKAPSASGATADGSCAPRGTPTGAVTVSVTVTVLVGPPLCDRPPLPFTGPLGGGVPVPELADAVVGIESLVEAAEVAATGVVGVVSVGPKLVVDATLDDVEEALEPHP